MPNIVAIELNPKHPQWKKNHEFFCDLLVEDLIFRICKTGAEWAECERSAEVTELEEKIRQNPDGLWVAFDRSNRRFRGMAFTTVELEDADASTLVVHAAAGWGVWNHPNSNEKAGEWCRPLLNEFKIYARHEGCASIVYRGHPYWAKHFPSCRVADNEDQVSDRIH